MRRSGSSTDRVDTSAGAAWTRLAAASRRRRSQGAGQLHLLRYVPGDSPVHRLWAGTKLLSVLAVGLVLSLRVTWGAEGVLAALLVGGAAVGRIPRGALPRPPLWILAGLAVGAALSLVAGGHPEVHAGGIAVGFGSLILWSRFIVLTVLLLGISFLVAWTTPLADLAPALGALLRPLRALRVPVDEAVVGVALSVRSLPLLVDELRSLQAARRVRRPERARTARDLGDEAVDLLVCAFVAATRRAREMGDALEARGGVLAPAGGGARIGTVDLVAGAVVGLAVAAMAVV